MKIVILAAGRGAGLEELTEDRPKCMLKLGNETILERQIRILTDKGISADDIVIVAGYLASVIQSHVSVKIIQNEAYKTTDNTYSLFLALEHIDDDVIILDGDLVFDEGIAEQILSAKGNYLAGIQRMTGYGLTGMEIDPDTDRISTIGKHIESEYTYASIFRVQKSDLGVLKAVIKRKENWKNWYTVPINSLLAQVKFQLLLLSRLVYDINTASDYTTVRRLLGVGKYKILVTGASGFLGNKIYNIFKREYDIIGIRGTSRGEGFHSIDLTDRKTLASYLELVKPDIVIHTAGIPEPEKCDENRDAAYMVNVQAVQNLVDECRTRRIKLIHISTDYVFAGTKEDFYKKTDERRPVNYYGETKKEAEDIVLGCEESLIVRVPVLYGYNDERDKKTFPIKVLEQLEKGLSVEADDIQVRYPVLIDEVAFAVKEAIERKGIIHITSEKGVTKYQWAKIIAKEFGYSETLVKPTYREQENRPRHVRLECAKEDFIISDIVKGTQILHKQLKCAFKLIYKSAPNACVYGLYVGVYRYRLGQYLAEKVRAQIDVSALDYIVPVPMSGLYYAMGLAEALHVPYLQALVKPDTAARSFQIADIAAREKVIQDKIYPIAELIDGKSIALVDEAIFTGTTLRVVCDMVKACGAKKIHICIPTPICKNGCRQYVQPERKMLAEEYNESELKDYFGVDSIVFLDSRRFSSTLVNVRGICQECLKET